MNNFNRILISLFVVSAGILCFEVVATRIASVIFVNHYAFMILSLSILGLGVGGIYAYYRHQDKQTDANSVVSGSLLSIAGSLLLFILAVNFLPVIDTAVIFFALLIIPFFAAGIFYATIFREFASNSFTIYAADLTGGAIGALIAIAAITFLAPIPSVLVIILLISGIAFVYEPAPISALKSFRFSATPIIAILFLNLYAFTGFPGQIPIGNFPEKDFHHVYSDPGIESTIMESRWSIFGRSDLVRHSHQDNIRHMFIDGAAGTQMFRFNGNISQPDEYLTNQLLAFSSTLPLLVLEDDESRSMLNIGPGGGQEILAGLLFGVDNITGVEINSDFVELVKDHREFNGGLYTDFDNVHILKREGRQYAKQNHDEYDLLVMVLPSTQQVQNIENYALSENYLITVEAIEDYLDVLTESGRMVFTVYNEAELKRLISTVVKAFERRGIASDRVPYHLVAIEDADTPTLVIKKNPFTQSEVESYGEFMQQLPDHAPSFTYLPYQWDNLSQTSTNQFIENLYQNEIPFDELIARESFDISPTYDDSPYFYKIVKGIPDDFSMLLYAVFGINLIIITIPYMMVKNNTGRKRKKKSNLTRKQVRKPLLLFAALGLGFMIVEIALFQKLVLYLGTPTVSLSVLLSCLLIGMGIGSYSGNTFFSDNHYKRLMVFTGAIVLFGAVVILLYPLLLEELLVYGLATRAVVTFFLLLPLGFILGIPFPTCIRIVESEGLDKIIPWMYGINGTMSVLGSVLAVVFSMQMGFTPAYFIGLVFYFFIFIYCAYRVPYRKWLHKDAATPEM